MKVGIFGGSFNPPHKMHKRIGLELIKKGYVDKIIYVPVQDNYNKKDLLPFKDRYNMVKQMIKGNNDLLVSSLARFGYIYTYMVLDYFSKKYDKVYFICGCDNLKDFKNWKKYDYILKNYKLLVIDRNNEFSNVIKSFNNKNNIKCDIEASNISSSSIRNDISKLYERLDSRTIKYIINNELYKSRSKNV